MCDGATVACPANGFLTNGTVCNDGNVCNIGETCQSGVCTGGAPPNCSGAGDQCNTASCNPGGSEGNCATLTPVTNGTVCDDGVACTSASCSAGVCVGTPSASVTVNLDAEGLSNAVTRNVTFDITICGGSTDTRVLPIAFDASGLGSIVLNSVDANADWISVKEGHTLRRLAALSFVSCGATASFTGAGVLFTGDFQAGAIPQDNIVDISDFSILATRWNQVISANSSTGADANGDGVQATADFTAIQVNFLRIGDATASCLSGILSRGSSLSGRRLTSTPVEEVLYPRDAIGADELRMLDGEAADMNNDGVVDVSDIREFARLHDLPLLPEFEDAAESPPIAKPHRSRR